MSAEETADDVDQLAGVSTTPREFSRRVALRARSLRIARRWSAADMAARITDLGVPISRAVVANRETRPDAPAVSVDDLVAYARALGVSVLDLLGDAEVPLCATCSGAPPAGFSCRSCGANA